MVTNDGRIHIRGVHIGSHGSLAKFASLQMRISQIMFTPQVESPEQCLFLPDDSVDLDEELNYSHLDEILASITSNVEPTPIIKNIESLADKGATSSAQTIPPPSSHQQPRRAQSGSLARRRKVSLAPLELEPPSKVFARESEGRELMEQYMSLDYGSQDPTDMDFNIRQTLKQEITGKLVTLLGEDWEVRYYHDFYNQRQAEIYNSK